MSRAALTGWIVAFVLVAGAALAGAPMTRAEVQTAIRNAGAGHPIGLAGRSLVGADLSGLDLAGADLAHADLDNVNLSDADLTGANLTGAKLNLAWLMRTNLTRANLSGVALHGPVTAPGMEDVPKDAPILVGADFAGAQIIARLNGNAAGASFAHANLGADISNQSMGMLRTDFNNANLRGADFEGARLDYATLRFADLTGANLRGARLHYADLSGADLTHADLTGADLTDADLTDAILTDAKGLATVKGFRPRHRP